MTVAFKRLTLLSLFALLVGCGVPEPRVEEQIDINTINDVPATSQSVLEDDQIVVIETSDSDLPIVAFFPTGEILVIKESKSQDNVNFSIENIIYLSMDNKPLIVYFDDGIPARAFTENIWVGLFDIQADVTNIKIASEYQDNATFYNVPFDQEDYRSEPEQSSEVFSLVNFAVSNLRMISCTALPVIEGGGIEALKRSCLLSVSSDYLSVRDTEDKLMNCRFGALNENIQKVSECVQIIINTARDFEEVAIQQEDRMIIESSVPSESTDVSAWKIDVPLNYEGESISCSCQNCSCDANPFFRMVLTIDEFGSVTGVLQKYTELFPEIPLVGNLEEFGGIVEVDDILATLKFEGGFSEDRQVISGQLSADFEESGASGVRELVLYLTGEYGAVLEPLGTGVTPSRSPVIETAAAAAESKLLAGISFLEDKAYESYEGELEIPGSFEYTVVLSSSKDMAMGYFWCATEDKFTQNWDNIELKFLIEGKPISGENLFIFEFPSDNFECRVVYTILSDWVGGEHHLQLITKFKVPLNDGVGDYPAGEWIYNYNVIVKP